jgi:predicted GTPase
MQTSVPVVVVTGTIGVGKTAIAMTMSEILHERGIRHGLLEVDWLGEVYPAPYPDDPYSTRFAMKNLAAIWPNFLEVGITRAIVAMTLENHQELVISLLRWAHPRLRSCDLKHRLRHVRSESDAVSWGISSIYSWRRAHRSRLKWSVSRLAT